MLSAISLDRLKQYLMWITSVTEWEQALEACKLLTIHHLSLKSAIDKSQGRGGFLVKFSFFYFSISLKKTLVSYRIRESEQIDILFREMWDRPVTNQPLVKHRLCHIFTSTQVCLFRTEETNISSRTRIETPIQETSMWVSFHRIRRCLLKPWLVLEVFFRFFFFLIFRRTFFKKNFLHDSYHLMVAVLI